MESEKRESITAVDVEHAFDTIFQRGKLKPSQKDILAELKRGSETTIRQHLNQLYLSRLAPDSQEELDVPKELQQEVVALWTKACDFSAAKWLAEKAEQQDLLEQMQAQHDHLAEQIHQQQESHLTQAQESKTAYEAQAAELESANKECEAQQGQLDRFEQTLVDQREALATAKTELVQLNQEIKTQTQQFQLQHAKEQQRTQSIEDSLHRKIDESRVEKKLIDDAHKRLQAEYTQAQVAWQQQQSQMQSEQQALHSELSESMQQFQAKNIVLAHTNEQLAAKTTECEQLTADTLQLSAISRQEHDLLIEQRAQNQLLLSQIESLQTALTNQGVETTRAQCQLEDFIKQQSEAITD